MITRFVINHLVTVPWENIFPEPSPALCSKVLDLLRPRMPLVALFPSLEHGSADSADAAAVTREGIAALAVSSTSPQGTSQEPAFFASPSSHGPQLNHAAGGQQFLLALLENCSFFAHLVLRCVRAARGSPHGSAKQESVRPRPNYRPRQSQAQLISNSFPQRLRQNPPTLEAEPLSPQTLWVEVACRHMRDARSQEGMS